jgi:uncharacterized protein YgiM (DUF1202 family)
MKRLVALLVLLTAITVHASPVWVAVKKTVIRKEASNLSPMIVQVNYQDELDLLNERGDWWQVSYGDKEGWVHKSALSKSLEQAAGSTQKASGGSIFDALKGKPADSQSRQSSDKQRGGDADDITLAGKGFNEDVEGEFKSQGANVNYDAVDKMENRDVPDFDFRKFAEQGGLKYSFEQVKAEQEESKGGFSFPGGLFK